jgi:4-amino-4-deoxy-L-arabinose transferase-like glycosyltransferase
VSPRTAPAALLIVAALSILPGLGRATLWEPDEPRFAEATRQMFARHDFVTPYFNGVPRFEKPILLYWLQAAAHGVAPDELAARLPSALAGVGSVLLLFLLASRLTTRTAALIAGVALATMFRFVALARQGLTDVPVLFFILAALYGFVGATTGRSARAAWLAWVAVGLGILTKGPVGLLPVIIWTAYALVRRERALVAMVRPIAGPAIALLIAAPWYVLMAAKHGRAFVDFALGHEIVARVLSDDGFAPDRGLLYYVKVWPGDAAPWSLLFIAAVAWAGLRWKRLDLSERRAFVFALVWFLSVFLVFSFSRSKVPHYVLPAYPAAAMVIGMFIDRVARGPNDALWWRVPGAIIAVALLALAVLLAWSIDVLMPGAAAIARWSVPLIVALGAVAIAACVWRARAVSAAASLALALGASFAVIGAVVIPDAVEAFKPMPRLARAASPLLQPAARIGLLGRYGASSLIYYSGHDVEWLLDDAATVAFARHVDAVCVMPEDDYKRLAPQLPPTLRVIDSAEEFNVRIERLLDRQRTRGREWVLLAGAR